MKLSDILQVKRLKNIFGKRTNSLLGHTVTADSKQRAQEKVLAEVKMRNDAQAFPRYYKVNDTTVFVLYYGISSWCYDITELDGNFPRTSTCVINKNKSENEAIKMLRDHIKQYNGEKENE